MLKQKLTKRQVQANKTREKIYKISVDLMEKKGFNNITIADISKKAGVSIGAFYHYYKSKDDIFFEIYKRGDEYFKNEVARDIAQSNLGTTEQITQFFRHYAAYNKSRGLENVSQLYNSKNKLFIARGRYMQVLLQEIITKGQEKKELTTEMSPEKMTEYLFIAARGIIFDWCLHEGDYDMEEFIVDYMKRLVSLFTVTS